MEKLVTPPASEPISLTEAKEQLRVDTSDEDNFITGLIEAARLYFEDATGRGFITQTWRLNLDEWPDSNQIALPRPPLQAVTEVVYLDEDGDESTLPAESYIVDSDSEPGRIVLASFAHWPNVNSYPANPIQITFEAGYGDDGADVPAHYRQGIKLLIGHWYENREAILVGTISKEIELAVSSLIWLNRAY